MRYIQIMFRLIVTLNNTVLGNPRGIELKFYAEHDAQRRPTANPELQKLFDIVDFITQKRMVEHVWRSKSVRLSENGISQILSWKCCVKEDFTQ
jgi:hypothetical protein